MKSLYLVFLTQVNDQQYVLLFQNTPQNPFSLPHIEITKEDFQSASLTGPKIILDQLKNIELQKFSFFKKEYLDLIDFDNYNYKVQQIWSQSSQEEKELLRHKRNIQAPLWTQYFNNCPLWNDDKEENFYYILKLQQNDIDYIQQQQGLIIKQVNIQELQESMSMNFPEQKDKFINLQNALINNDYLRKDGRVILHFNFKTKQYSIYDGSGFYLDTVSVYNGIFRRRYDNWNQYNVAQGHYPNDDIIERADAIIMPGNRISVYDHYKWIEDVKVILKKAYETNPKVKILGICFGFQILTTALGGNVEEMKNDFVFGNTILNHNINVMKQFKLFQGMQLQEQTIINQAHGDEITKYPEFLQLISSSESCKNEIMISKDERILVFQGHPEYFSAGMNMLSLASRLPSELSTLEQVIKEVKRLYPQEQDSFHLNLCLKFLKIEK
ncbi:unnamed protein product [Paramecium pentaurelia]|uniref:Glutamine amidotransferase domain-containing protein n=1 Tax=Paramecium pentaurelia TaxID=43138 RepID=A0A8S1UHZ1_9CILI|nr:unnamed protein product [Paramecium pentaurelia]